MVLVTVESFDNQLKARLAKLKLEQAGVESVLIDIETITMDWFLGRAIGLIKLQVRGEDFAEAQEILNVSDVGNEGNSRRSNTSRNMVFFRWGFLFPVIIAVVLFSMWFGFALSQLIGIRPEPLQGGIAATLVLLASYVLPPKFKILVASISLFIGGWLVWNWIPPSAFSSDSQGPVDWKEGYIPVAATYIAGVQVYLGCAIFDTFYGEQSNQPLHTDRASHGG